MSANFTIILPTLGRPTLGNMLDAVKMNLGLSDHVVVVVDSFYQGDRPDVQALVRGYGDQFECYAYDSGYNFLGVEQFNYAVRSLPIFGSHVFWLSDDDVIVDDAMSTYREFCRRDMMRPLIPRFVPPWHENPGCELIWDLPRMQRAKVTGAMVVPRRFLQQVPTNLDCCVDYDWMVNILKKSSPPVWLDFVSVLSKPPTRNGEIVHRGVWECDSCKQWGYLEDIQSLVCPKCNRAVRHEAREVEAM